ncbi:MAG: hypothetical protein SP4CHLAM5_07810 [Chlamydiia bacterium]|nr:hypothetical protein [Chlamydiia bacterium]MCH9618645.1 hypothetical protein [Chlamydiia bacterium]MCH9623836.1 hypothetical protein [Chlamydiia bacterium]
MRYLFTLTLFFLPLFSKTLDVVIPIHRKDAKNLDTVIAKVKEHIEDVGRIIVISKERFSYKAEWVDEKDFPFSIVDVANELCGNGGVGNHIRRGWYYQQLLKLYAHYVIDDLTDDILILDGDTVPTRKMSFFDKQGKVYLNARHARRYTATYKRHALKLLPEEINLNRLVNPVVHHMVFTKEILDDLFSRVEEKYAKPFWQVFANLVAPANDRNTRLFDMGASEYVIYYFFSTHFHSDKVSERFIKTLDNANSLDHVPSKNVWFMSKHNYDRTE